MLKHAATVASFIVLLALAGVFGAERAQAAATCGGKAATIVGTNAANVLVGTKHADVIVARGGADRVRGRGGEDVICAGPGNDYVDGGPRHDVVRGQVGHDTCVTSPGGGADLFVSCEDRTAFDLQMDDQLDWAWVEDAAGVRPLEGDNVTTTLRMGAGGVGHAGYRRTRVSPHGFVSGTATPLTFAELDDSRANVHLPFAMPFFGIRYHNVSVSTNGYVSFGAPAKDYMNDYQFTDFRGFNYVLGQYERGAMPYWSDLDLTNGGTGAGTVSVVKSTNRVAIKWDTGECCSGEPPHRKFQLVLFDDGRMRYDYISSTPPDSGPNPAFIGLSDGSGTRGLDSVGRSGFTFLRAEVTLPQSTLPVRSTAGFTMPGDVVLANQTITCTGKTARRFTGCTGGTGTQNSGRSVHQLLPTPNKSILYTPFKAAAIAAPAGKVTLTLPRGSTLVDAPAACSKVVAPTSAKDGFVSCPVPQLSLGENVIRKITWESPPNMGHGQDTQPNVNMRATYAPRRSPRSVDLEESLLSYTDPIRTTMSPFLDYTGPTPAHTPDALTFNTGALPDEGPLADPVVEIRVPAHMHLNSTTFPSCGHLAGFGGGSVFCSLPNGAGGSYSGDLTFHANAPGTYRPKVTFFADNAPTAAKRRTLTVSP